MQLDRTGHFLRQGFWRSRRPMSDMRLPPATICTLSLPGCDAEIDSIQDSGRVGLVSRGTDVTPINSESLEEGRRDRARSFASKMHLFYIGSVTYSSAAPEPAFDFDPPLPCWLTRIVSDIADWASSGTDEAASLSFE